MGEQECPYSVLDVASLIQSRYAYITGNLLLITCNMIQSRNTFITGNLIYI